MFEQIPHPGFHRTLAPGSTLLQLSFLRDLLLYCFVYTCTRRKWGREHGLLRINCDLKSAKLISLTQLPEPELGWHTLTFSYQFWYLNKEGPVFVSELPTCITKTALKSSLFSSKAQGKKKKNIVTFRVVLEKACTTAIKFSAESPWPLPLVFYKHMKGLWDKN